MGTVVTVRLLCTCCTFAVCLPAGVHCIAGGRSEAWLKMTLSRMWTVYYGRLILQVRRARRAATPSMAGALMAWMLAIQHAGRRLPAGTHV